MLRVKIHRVSKISRVSEMRHKSLAGQSKGQSIIEFCIASVLTIFAAFFILEFAMYLQTLHSVQTFNDEINANIVLFKDSNICSSYNSDILDLVESRAGKYLEKGLEFSYKKNAKDIARIESDKALFGNKVLRVEIICNTTNEGFVTRSEYLYRGLFIFKTGKKVSSLSSVQTPKF